jgi:hypothetical protein
MAGCISGPCGFSLGREGGEVSKYALDLFIASTWRFKTTIAEEPFEEVLDVALV